MPTVKEKIVIGSTFSVKYECLEPGDETDNPWASARTPKPPTAATAELFDVGNQVYIPLGTAGAQAVDAQVDGNVVSYTLPAYEITAEGDYKLIISVTFPDGQIARDIRPFKVTAIS